MGPNFGRNSGRNSVAKKKVKMYRMDHAHVVPFCIMIDESHVSFCTHWNYMCLVAS